MDDILTELAALPTHLIVRASRDIATTARLGWWQPEKQPRQIIPARRTNLFFQRITDRLWPKAPPAPFPSDRELLATNADFAWLFLFHPSGYLREAALCRIATPPTSPFFLAALALRLNDWVGPVRQAAARCVKHLAPDVAADVAADAAAYLLGRRFAWERWSDEAHMLDLVFARADVLAALAKRLQDTPTGPMGDCLRNALRFPDSDQHLSKLAATAIQPSVRAIAYKCLISRKAAWHAGFEWAWIDKVYGLRRRVPKLETRDIQTDGPVVDFIVAGIRDRSAFVRKTVADAMIGVRSQIEDEGHLVAQLAADPNPAVRSRGDFMVRHQGERSPSS
ncbi:hypothetical protein JQ604_30300 [Bradyrhizobium jicamae]|uniref:hypothetical protein n=1 Tax=Bradyrhizobium jicamae TaxID=280332 RepID=UPI001BA7C8AA|nr:hypothetical protein [Bradyrhizobium jicamae]MBR0756491.1 hypothetical protein [Bradyrhizobium jicamae]